MAALSASKSWLMGGTALGVSLVAWLSGHGGARLLAQQLELPEDASLTTIEIAGDGDDTDAAPAASDEPKPKRPALQRKPTRKAYVDPIVRRSIFDSTKVGVASSGPTELVDSEEEGRRSDLKVLLLATIVAEPAEYSSALIAEEKGGNGAAGYGVGDGLLGEATIVRIEARKVVIRRDDGTIEYIAMEEGKSPAKDTKAGTKKAGNDDDRVTKDGDKFVIDQSLIDQILENPEQLYSQIRAVPHKGTDGKIDGYRLSGIRRKSVFHQLGIKNGDIVHGVNGQELTSMSAAMDAFNSLQNERSFSFELTRRNNRKSQDYEIR